MKREPPSARRREAIVESDPSVVESWPTNVKMSSSYTRNDAMDTLQRQFVFSDRKELFPASWSWLRCNEQYIAFHPSLPVLEVYEENTGVHIGFMVGWPVSPDGQRRVNRIVMSSYESEDALHGDLYKYSGSWACMLYAEGEWRLYGDPFHSIPIVYHTNLNCISSSTGPIPSEYRSPHRSLGEGLNIPEDDNWYPFGLTPYHECRRLLPNHYLRLSTNEVVRHWPLPDTFRNSGKNKARSTLVDRLRKNIRAFVGDDRPYLHLTAGRDSRMLLACSKEVKDQFMCHTIRMPDERARIDCQVAEYITKNFDLEHKVQWRRSPLEADLEAWLKRTGHCVAGRTWRNVTTLKQLDASRPRLLGIGGEIGRAYYRPAADDSEGQLDCEKIVSLLHLPAIPEICQAAERWLDETPPGLDTWQLLDLLYIEQRIGCWASVTPLGHASSAYAVFPFCDRQIVEALVSLEESVKRSEAWITEIIERTWPDLLKVPFDRYVGWSRIKKSIQSRMSGDYIKRGCGLVYQNVRDLIR